MQNANAGGDIGLRRISLAPYQAPAAANTESGGATGAAKQSTTGGEVLQTQAPPEKAPKDSAIGAVAAFVESTIGLVVIIVAGGVLLCLCIGIFTCCAIRRGRQRGADKWDDAIKLSFRRSDAAFKAPQFDDVVSPEATPRDSTARTVSTQYMALPNSAQDSLKRKDEETEYAYLPSSNSTLPPPPPTIHGTVSPEYATQNGDNDDSRPYAFVHASSDNISN